MFFALISNKFAFLFTKYSTVTKTVDHLTFLPVLIINPIYLGPPGPWVPHVAHVLHLTADRVKMLMGHDVVVSLGVGGNGVMLTLFMKI